MHGNLRQEEGRRLHSLSGKRAVLQVWPTHDAVVRDLEGRLDHPFLSQIRPALLIMVANGTGAFATHSSLNYRSPAQAESDYPANASAS